LLRVYEVEGVFDREYTPFLGYTGFALRGAFGYALRKLVCKEDMDFECKRCKYYRSCIYSVIFEPSSLLRADASLARKGGREGVARPFVLEPRRVRGSSLSFNLILMGDAIKHEHAVIMAVIGMGFEGLGMDPLIKERRKFRVSRITCRDVVAGRVETIFTTSKGYSMALKRPVKVDLLSFFERSAKGVVEARPKSLRIDFKTPTNIRVEGETVSVPSLRHVVANLARRYSMLAYYFNVGKPLTASEAKRVIEAAERVSRATGHELKESLMKKMGVHGKKTIGTFFRGWVSYKLDWRSVDDDSSCRMMALLLLGKYMHVGNLATAGCGKYDLTFTI